MGRPIADRMSAAALAIAGVAFAAASLVPVPAQAHVKWFAPYIVDAAPQPIEATLTNVWFWTGIALVLAFFLATRAVERSRLGEPVLAALDRASDPLHRRLDDFMRVCIGGFFIAVFAVGGVYLTPDLQTPSEWVSWAQLVIAACVFSRRTMPIAAAGIVGLWLVALRDYDFFHLLDYLALGLGVAGYLVLASSENERFRRHRFETLRWAVAIALMWSSLEKFAYPDWFYPLVEERPFLTFGLPRDVFIPMAGIAEFTLGFGLIWTPLVRRLSALALLVIFTAAVYPFGRIDLVGHALIMAVILVIAADHERQVHFVPALKRRLAGVPAGLATALVVMVVGYWGLHFAFYGQGYEPAPGAQIATHAPNAEHPHGSVAPIEPQAHDVDSTAGVAESVDPAAALFAQANERMHESMVLDPSGDVDEDFVRGMIPHHLGAVEMAEIVLEHGDDPEIRALAREILAHQREEIRMMEDWLARGGG
ncbi:CopM family metallochaperone [Salinarimonas ramus]|uniref:DUF305 domain-containing protein n=1 Tax=Salinarimonas ramus TaxID=690164 RepID=A0A917Q4C6_9HYPH|nr:DUF305 domain-containing protein [Salinarimonas ramus]GGK20749.1 hypothetical protein GCM10011322_04290 [Salinarimonas ramus]